MSGHTIDPAQLAASFTWPRFELASLIEAWRQAHYAAQAAAELGKSWAPPQSDDSHSNLGWRSTGDLIGCEGVPAQGPIALRTRLDVSRLRLALYDGVDVVDAQDLAGMTVTEAVSWVGDRATVHLGERTQPAHAAPDLPEHPLAHGAQFAVHGALEHVAQLYDSVDRTLALLRRVMPSFREARCWPHHFDHASLAVVAQDGDGSMSKTIGVGITPPDGVDSSGYIYVSPWARDGAVHGDAPQLDHGHWHPRGSGPPMAVLPLSSFGETRDPTSAVPVFIAQAVNGCMEVLGV
ncbi:MAG: hypothetical protein AAFX05_03930 [Planctomycetota bacterium]